MRVLTCLALCLMNVAGSAADQAQFVSSSVVEAWSPKDGTRIDFEVLRQGDPFGRHSLQFERGDNGRLSVSTDVELSVKFGFVTVYKYTLRSEEVWQDNALVSVTGITNKNGDRFTMQARKDGNAMLVEGTGFSGSVPVPVIPSSHWNRLQVYRDQMLSTESGELLDIDVERLGRDTIIVAGEALETTHYRLKSDLNVDLWYDDQSRWVKLLFNARGQQIEYVLTSLYE